MSNKQQRKQRVQRPLPRRILARLSTLLGALALCEIAFTTKQTTRIGLLGQAVVSRNDTNDTKDTSPWSEATSDRLIEVGQIRDAETLETVLAPPAAPVTPNDFKSYLAFFSEPSQSFNFEGDDNNALAKTGTSQEEDHHLQNNGVEKQENSPFVDFNDEIPTKVVVSLDSSGQRLDEGSRTETGEAQKPVSSNGEKKDSESGVALVSLDFFEKINVSRRIYDWIDSFKSEKKQKIIKKLKTKKGAKKAAVKVASLDEGKGKTEAISEEKLPDSSTVEQDRFQDLATGLDKAEVIQLGTMTLPVLVGWKDYLRDREVCQSIVEQDEGEENDASVERRIETTHFLDIVNSILDKPQFQCSLDASPADEALIIGTEPERVPDFIKSVSQSQITRQMIEDSSQSDFQLDSVDDQSSFQPESTLIRTYVLRQTVQLVTHSLSLFASTAHSVHRAYVTVNKGLICVANFAKQVVVTILTWPFEENLSPSVFNESSVLDQELLKTFKMRKNFASSSSGANVLAASSGIVNKGAILASNQDQYLIVNECNSHHTETVTINLSDDVQIDTILVSFREDFSSRLGDITFYGSIDYPPNDGKWTYLGSLAPELSTDSILQLQIAHSGGGAGDDSASAASSQSSSGGGQHQMVRYLNVAMTGHERNDNGLYCTITSITVFGSSVHQVMRDISHDLFQYEEEEEELTTSGNDSDKDEEFTYLYLGNGGGNETAADGFFRQECPSQMMYWHQQHQVANTSYPVATENAEAKKSIMDSLAGIDDQLNELRRRGDNHPPLDLPVAAVILPVSVSQSGVSQTSEASATATTADSTAVDDLASSEDEQPQDLGGLLKVMIKKLNQNEKGQKELTQQFIKQNELIGETLQYLSSQLKVQQIESNITKERFNADLGMLLQKLNIGTKRLEKKLWKQESKLESLERGVENLQTLVYFLVFFVFGGVALAIVRLSLKEQRSQIPSLIDELSPVPKFMTIPTLPLAAKVQSPLKPQKSLGNHKAKQKSKAAAQK